MSWGELLDTGCWILGIGFIQQLVKSRGWYVV